MNIDNSAFGINLSLDLSNYLTLSTYNTEKLTAFYANDILAAGLLSIGTTNPSQLFTLNGGGFDMNCGFDNNTSRPAISTAINDFTIRGVGGGVDPINDESDDGFLRLKAGGGLLNNSASYIDLSGKSLVDDMDKNIIMGTNGTEKVRITGDGVKITGGLGIGGAIPGLLSISIGDTDTGFNQETDGIMTAKCNNVEIMRWSSTGIGILTGTTSLLNLSIGDADTGFNQEGDGILAVKTNGSERARWNSDGMNVTGDFTVNDVAIVPNYHCYCMLSTTGTTNVENNNTRPIYFDVTDYNTDPAYINPLWVNDRCGAINIEIPGWYSVEYKVCFDSNGNGKRGAELQIENNDSISFCHNTLNAVSGKETIISGSTIMRMYQYDSIFVRVYQDSGGNLNACGSGYDKTSYVKITRIGDI